MTYIVYKVIIEMLLTHSWSVAVRSAHSTTLHQQSYYTGLVGPSSLISPGVIKNVYRT